MGFLPARRAFGGGRRCGIVLPTAPVRQMEVERGRGERRERGEREEARDERERERRERESERVWACVCGSVCVRAYERARVRAHELHEFVCLCARACVPDKETETD